MIRTIDLAYIAGIVDGEAYIGIKKTKAYKCQDRVTPGYHARIQVRMIDESAIQFVAKTFDGRYYKEKSNSINRRPLFCFQASDRKAEKILSSLYPYLKVKRKNAKAVLALRILQNDNQKYRTKVVGHRNFPNRYGVARIVPNLAYCDAYVALCDELYEHCKRLNH